jgi:drug/metabolite transporter (DMT)-like permease
MSWFALSLGAAVTQAAQFAVVKARAQAIPPLVIVASNQLVAVSAWAGYFLVSRDTVVRPDARAWLVIVGSAVLVAMMNGLLARASARGDISVVGPVFALSPIFTVLPDAVLSGTLPSPLGWFGLALSVTGTVSLSGGAGVASRLRSLALVTRPAGVRAALRPQNLATLVAHGALGVSGTAMQTTALTTAPAAYVNAVRRMSAVVAVVLGSTMFREPDLGRRLAAALLACAGAACLLLAR